MEQTSYLDHINGEEKMVPIHKRVKEMANSKMMNNIRKSSLITDNRSCDANYHH